MPCDGRPALIRGGVAGLGEGGAWLPLDEPTVHTIVDFYMSGLQLYSSVVEVSDDLEVDLAAMVRGPRQPPGFVVC